MLSSLRKRPFTSMITVGAIFIGTLAGGTYLDNGWAPAQPTPVVAINVGENADPAVDAWNVALAHALLSAGYEGDESDDCDCVYVPVGAHVVVPGYGDFNVQP